MKAPNEYAWAAFLDLLAVPYRYEALEPALSRALRYQPDFWLPDSLAWLEIKPHQHRPTPGEARAARQLVEATGHAVYLAAGWPEDIRLRIWAYFRGREGEAAGSLAIVWLAILLDRRPSQVLAASRAVMVRQWEFVRMWQKEQSL